MLFNSLEFLLFFPIVAIVYYALGSSIWLRNGWLLIASYFFYINLNPACTLILFASTVVTFFCGRFIERAGDSKRKKMTLVICLLLDFSSLFIFKYYNFINDSIGAALSVFNLSWDLPHLGLILPIGISFYTFQSAGYVIDVYRGTVKAEKSFPVYALFVSFFPFILAGPIQRSKVLIPQLKECHPVMYENVICGLRMILWGFFMKLCVADRLGTYVDTVYDGLLQHNGTTISIASLFYSIQVYCDFGGYSLIALGCARALGFHLPENFKRPYFSLSIKDFWKRWHIGLSSWFRDYLYIPLGGNRVKYCRYLLNLLIVFVVSGLWHGAAWTFVFWGLLHGLYQVAAAILKKFGLVAEPQTHLLQYLKMLFVFLLVSVSWIFFRANSFGDAILAISRIITNPGKPYISPMAVLLGTISILILFIKDFADEFRPNWRFLSSNNKLVSVFTFAILAVYIVLFGVLDNSQFIYFKF